MNKMRCLRSLFALCALFLASTLSAQTTPSRADSFTIQALKAQPGSNSLYEIAFIPRDTLATDAEIVINFPAACALSELEIAGSTDINGGLQLTRDGQQVTVRRSGLGDALPPGQRVSLKLGMIGNPEDLNASYAAEVTVQSSAQAAPNATQRIVIGF